ncbi:MAG TPA: hypothetical protein VL025_08295 [Thermoanaerobaculia bacterium]|nr:hypothetical protein [Thermoanaerobaculia bacterium]
MKMRHALLIALALTVMASTAAMAAPVHYGTGIYLWALSCGPFPDGHSTVAYVSSSVCPNNPPAGCTCTRTTHDFPVDHPYPTRVAPGVNPEDPGDVTVLLDAEGAIQCGATVQPPVEDNGTCGAPFTGTPVDASEVAPELLELVESLRFEIEDKTGVPVHSFSYVNATRR